MLKNNFILTSVYFLGLATPWLAIPLLTGKISFDRYWLYLYIRRFSCEIFSGAIGAVSQALRISALIVPAIAISNVIEMHYMMVDGQERMFNILLIVFAVLNVPLVYVLMILFA